MNQDATDSKSTTEAGQLKRRVRFVSRESLADWENEDKDIGDDLHVYFSGTYGEWYWCDISCEGRAVWETMFDETIEYDSPIANIIAAVAAQSAHGAFAAVAAAIGVSEEEIEVAVSSWYENQKNLPPSVGYDGLEKEVEKTKQWLDGLKRNRRR